jgi:hypothetical protein
MTVKPQNRKAHLEVCDGVRRTPSQRYRFNLRMAKLRASTVAVAVIPLALLCGCKLTTIKHTWPDKSVTEVNDARLMYRQRGTFTLSNQHATVQIQFNSTSDNKAIEAAAEGAARGAMKGAMP